MNSLLAGLSVGRAFYFIENIHIISPDNINMILKKKHGFPKNTKP